MSPAQAIGKLSGETAGERELNEREACALMSAMLDGGTGERELGALIERKPVTLVELLGYCSARIVSPTGVLAGAPAHLC